MVHNQIESVGATPRNLARQWAVEAARDFAPPETIPLTEIDYLLPEVPPNAGEIALEMFDEIIHVLEEVRSPATAVLSLPIRPPWTEELVTDGPGLQSCIDGPWDRRAAPNFHLIGRQEWGLRWEIEEYRRWVPCDFSSLRPVQAFFRVHRTLQERADGDAYSWDYNLTAPPTPTN